MILSGILAVERRRIGAATVPRGRRRAAVGLAIGDTAETVAGGIGGPLGALSAAAVVVGALRRGATRFGVARVHGRGRRSSICLVALIPVAGYVARGVLPVLAARMRGRQAARFAGLRTLAK